MRYRSRFPSAVSICFSALAFTACNRAVTNAAKQPTAAAVSAPAANLDGPSASEMAPAVVALGDSLFNKGACWRCHAVGGVGTVRGPSLVAGPWIQNSGTFEEIVATIIRGVSADAIKDKSRTYAMNPRGGPMNLTDERARAVAAYVWSISRKK